MSAYIQMELDALNVVGDVGSACGLDGAYVAHGLLKLWAWCFRAETDVVKKEHIKGFFCGSESAADALVSFGFLTLSDHGLVVKGMGRYSKAKEARRKGGLAAKHHLKPGAFHLKNRPKTSNEAAHGSAEGSAQAAADEQPRLEPRLQPKGSSGWPSALDPRTEILDPLLKEEESDFSKPQELQKLWNELKSPAQPVWREMTDKRRTNAKQRLQEKTLADWRAVIERIASSDFCNGQNDRGWVADVEFLLRPDTATKVLEGKYDNRTPTARHKPTYDPNQGIQTRAKATTGCEICGGASGGAVWGRNVCAAHYGDWLDSDLSQADVANWIERKRLEVAA